MAATTIAGSACNLVNLVKPEVPSKIWPEKETPGATGGGYPAGGGNHGLGQFRPEFWGILTFNRNPASNMR